LSKQKYTRILRSDNGKNGLHYEAMTFDERVGNCLWLPPFPTGMINFNTIDVSIAEN
jgi:hypothetical protein